MLEGAWRLGKASIGLAAAALLVTCTAVVGVVGWGTKKAVDATSQDYSNVGDKIGRATARGATKATHAAASAATGFADELMIQNPSLGRGVDHVKSAASTAAGGIKTLRDVVNSNPLVTPVPVIQGTPSNVPAATIPTINPSLKRMFKPGECTEAKTMARVDGRELNKAEIAHFCPQEATPG